MSVLYAAKMKSVWPTLIKDSGGEVDITSVELKMSQMLNLKPGHEKKT